MKGADAGVAQTVAAKRAGCVVHLALNSIEENGIAVPTGNYRGYRRSYDDDDDNGDDFEAEEMSDRSAVGSHWRRPDGAASHSPIYRSSSALLAQPNRTGELDLAQSNISPIK